MSFDFSKIHLFLIVDLMTRKNFLVYSIKIAFDSDDDFALAGFGKLCSDSGVAIISDVSNLQFYHSECRASIRCQNIADPKSKNVSIFVQDDLLLDI